MMKTGKKKRRDYENAQIKKILIAKVFEALCKTEYGNAPLNEVIKAFDIEFRGFISYPVYLRNAKAKRLKANLSKIAKNRKNGR